MASIYLASADAGGEPQVLKVMRLVGGETGDHLQRFIQEFALLAQVKHPNVARIHRQGFSRATPTSRWSTSRRATCARAMTRGVPPATALAYMKQIAAALEAIHGVGSCTATSSPTT